MKVVTEAGRVEGENDLKNINCGRKMNSLNLQTGLGEEKSEKERKRESTPREVALTRYGVGRLIVHHERVKDGPPVSGEKCEGFRIVSVEEARGK